MKKEISSTIPMELTPNWAISFTYCFKNIRIRSGREKVRPISNMYRPKVVSHFCMIMPINSNSLQRYDFH